MKSSKSLVFVQSFVRKTYKDVQNFVHSFMLNLFNIGGVNVVRKILVIKSVACFSVTNIWLTYP